jgi:hypothetical protein
MALWEGHTHSHTLCLKVTENKALRRIFDSRRDEIIGGWRKLHNELHNMYSSPKITRMI